MPPKIDFHLQLDKLLNASDIKVGQDATLQQEEGSWTCSLGSQLLGTVPASLIPDLQSHDSCKATIRSLKRSIEDPDQVSSVQVRISISPAGMLLLSRCEVPLFKTRGTSSGQNLAKFEFYN